MNLNFSPTQEQLATLLASCDDSQADHIAWVDHNGNVHITAIPEELGAIRFQESNSSLYHCFGTYMCGAGYVGEEASEDSEWVNELFVHIMKSWDML